jgi:hypothetical protein
VMTAPRESRALRRMREYDAGWDRLRVQAARLTHRDQSKTLIQSSEEYKIKKALLENLNIVFDLDEFSGDNIFYSSLRGDSHPNAPTQDWLSKMRVVQKGPWDGNKESPGWRRSEYLDARLRRYEDKLMHGASYSLTDEGSLEVVGTGIKPESTPVQPPPTDSVTFSVDLPSRRLIIHNNSIAFIFWSIEPPENQTCDPQQGGIYPNESTQIRINNSDPFEPRGTETWLLKTETGLNIPITFSWETYLLLEFSVQYKPTCSPSIASYVDLFKNCLIFANMYLASELGLTG